MKKYLLLIISLVLIAIPLQTLAVDLDINTSIIKAYNQFIKKVENKYNDNEKIQVAEILGERLKKIKSKKPLSSAKQKLVTDLIALNNEQLFNWEFGDLNSQGENKLNNFNITSSFPSRNKMSNPHGIFKENNIWYSYKFDEYLHFPTETKITESDLSFNNINPNNDLIFIDPKSKRLSFINSFEKIKLADNNAIFGVSDKLSFLQELKSDKFFINRETDADLISIKEKVQELIKGKSDIEIINSIYSYILNNIEYTSIIDLEDKKIFSGIETYTNNDGVCEGYARIMKYMLNYAGISDVELMKGFVIDSTDFPQIGHAWIRIGDKYYDPTFDDPIGLTTTKTFSEYKYFGLPIDLFYTNRYDVNQLPQNLKEQDLTYRKFLVKSNLSELANKYINHDYNILKPFQFRLNHNMTTLEKITISKLSNILPYAQVENYKFLNQDGKIKSIKKLNFFTVTDNDIEALLEQFGYEFDDYYLFKWILDDGGFEYRIAFNLTYH